MLNNVQRKAPGTYILQENLVKGDPGAIVEEIIVFLGRQNQ